MSQEEFVSEKNKQSNRDGDHPKESVAPRPRKFGDRLSVKIHAIEAGKKAKGKKDDGKVSEDSEDIALMVVDESDVEMDERVGSVA